MRRAALVIIACFLVLVTVTAATTLADTPFNATTVKNYAVLWNNGVVVVLVGQQYGTGWWVSDHYLVTAAHVVNYQSNIKVTLVHVDWVSTGVVVYVDNAHDVAVIRADGRPANQYVFSLALSMPNQGTQIYVIGYPFELYKITGDIKVMSANPRVTQGIISWIYPDKKIFEFSAPTDAGNSGGPIVTYDGAVVGLVSFALEGKVANMYYGSSVSAIKAALKAAGVKYRTALGVGGAPALGAGSTYYQPWIVAIALGVGASVVTTALLMPMVRRRK